MALSEGTLSILSFLQDNPDSRYTNAQLASELGRGGRSISGSIRSLVNKGLVNATEVAVETEAKTTIVKTYGITEAGLTFDPNAVAVKAPVEE